MKLYIANAFSLSMIGRQGARRFCTPVDDPKGYLQNADEYGCPVVSVVGHADVAAIFSNILGRDISVNRVSIKLGDEERVLVGQYSGPRLPEGTTQLPSDAVIEWWII